MATVAVAITTLNKYADESHVMQWTPLLNGDDGSPIEMPGWSIRSIQFTGTFGAGGTIQIEGSNDGTNYVVLTDPQGNNISKTSAALEAVVETTRYIRPRVTAGDVTTSLTASLLLRRTTR